MRKGLVVLVVPLVFELVFLSVLAFFLVRAEYEVEQRIHSKSIVSTAAIIVAKVVDAQCAAMLYNAYPTPMLELRFDDDKSFIAESVSKLKTLCQNDEPRRRLAQEIDLAIDENLKRFGRVFTKEIEENTSIQPFVESQARTDKTYRRFTQSINKIDELLNLEQKTQAAVHTREKYYRDSIRQAIVFGLSINIISTILLAIYYARSITGRLKVLLHNTSRLVAREKLEPKISGKDELAQLDDVFHATAKDLAYVDRHRKHLVRLVREELSAPLREVEYALQNLAHGVLGEITPKAESRLCLAIADTERITRLIDDLLSAEVMDGGGFSIEFAPVASNIIIETAVNSVKDMAERRKVKLQVRDCRVILDGDKDRLVQVLINFLSNAIKFSTEGGVVSVECKLDGVERILFSVTDQGRGIPGDKLDQIFEPFKQVEETDQTALGGTGLGLPISKTIVQQHGGKIGVNSEIGKGSQFWFQLPLKDSSSKSN